MTGTRVNPKRQSLPCSLPTNKETEAIGVMALAAPPPPPRLGKRWFPPLLQPVTPHQQPNSQRGDRGCHVAH